jgi:hypothetical protein
MVYGSSAQVTVQPCFALFYRDFECTSGTVPEFTFPTTYDFLFINPKAV